jgi:hypothetical protein
MNAFERKVLTRTLGPTKENTTWRNTYNNELYKQLEESSISNTGYTQKNCVVSKVNKKFISQLTRA